MSDISLLLDDQHQRGRMVPDILAELRAVAARVLARSASARFIPVGAPAASHPLPAAGATLFDPFHAPEVPDV